MIRMHRRAVPRIEPESPSERDDVDLHRRQAANNIISACSVATKSLSYVLVFAVILLLLGHLDIDNREETLSLPPDDESFSLLRLSRDNIVSARDESAPLLKDTGETIGAYTSQRKPVNVQYHVVFSTGCSPSQHWQSYVFFYHAWKSGQPGNVTRIASGCSPHEENELKRVHKEQVQIMSDQFYLHFTPEYKNVRRPSYKYFNKPFGLRHFLHHVLGYPDSGSHDDDIVILMDPDQMLLRPLTNDFTDSLEVWKPTKDGLPPRLRVEHGLPFGQLYGFGAQWLKATPNITYVAGPNSPIENVTIQEGRDYYGIGPPYIATARDMYRIALKWTEFAPRVYDNFRGLLAEMYAYSLAAAHLKLLHQSAKSFMVSNHLGAEAWGLIDSIPEKDICYNVPKERYPHTLHYCQEYSLGPWVVGKYSLRKDFLSCNSPLLEEPPDDIALQYNYSMPPGTTEKRFSRESKFSQREAFMLCTMTRGLNQAAKFFKKRHCKGANIGKTNNIHSWKTGKMIRPGNGSRAIRTIAL